MIHLKGLQFGRAFGQIIEWNTKAPCNRSLGDGSKWVFMVTDSYGLKVVEPNVVNLDEMINLRRGHGIDTVEDIFQGGQIFVS